MSLQPSSEIRLSQWLAFRGFEVRRAKGVLLAVVERKHPIKVALRLTGSGWIASVTRKAHECRGLTNALAEFNDAERIISGADGDALDRRVEEHFAGQPEHAIALAEYYQSQPAPGLGDVGRALPCSTGRGLWVPYPNLASLVSSLRWRDGVTRVATRHLRRSA